MAWNFDKNKCVECGACVSVCPFAALELEKNGLVNYKDKCTLCGICEKACPVTAIKVEKK
jgi:ferredoxin